MKVAPLPRGGLSDLVPVAHPRFPHAVPAPLWTVLGAFSAGGGKEHPTTRPIDRARPLLVSQPADEVY